MALHPGGSACRAWAADPGTSDPGGAVIGAVVAAAPLLSTAREVQLLADLVKQHLDAGSCSGPEVWQSLSLKCSSLQLIALREQKYYTVLNFDDLH